MLRYSCSASEYVHHTTHASYRAPSIRTPNQRVAKMDFTQNIFGMAKQNSVSFQFK